MLRRLIDEEDAGGRALRADDVQGSAQQQVAPGRDAALCLTLRTVWGIIGDLRRAGMLHVRKEGRRHHYTVNPNAPLRHPTLRRFTLRAVLGGITAHSGQRDGDRKQLTAARS